MRPKSCTSCGDRLECTCGTWDHYHEGFCDLKGSVCAECFELATGAIPLPPEPEPELSYVKDLSLEEIDALLVKYPEYAA